FALPIVFVTNHFSAAALYVTSSNSVATTVLTNDTDMTFQIGQFPAGQIAALSLVVSPRAFGPLTNTVTVAAATITNAITNAVTQVTAGQSDLGVGLTGPAEPIYANDWLTYTLAVTNGG